ncbi:MAG: type II toxin-antitoxin system Phd/YefM family antitoxin [Anaerolineae bacterium]
METKITATELAKSLSEVLNRIRYRGERFVIQRNGEPVAMLTPAGPGSPVSLRELAEVLAALPPPDDAFADDLEEIQLTQRPASIPK